MKRLKQTILLAGLICVVLQTEAASKPLDVVAEVDLERYEGRWYEIARLPNRFQESCESDVTAFYRLREDGRIDVLNACRQPNGEMKQAKGIARLADKNGPSAKLKVRFAPAMLSFLPFVWGDYWIIDLDADYKYAVVGDPGRKYLWILSRTPALQDDVFEQILDRIAEKGFEVSRIIETVQSQSFSTQ